jgi:hypothetical protein
MGQKITAILVGEMELLGYVTVKNNSVTVTAKGKKKLESYVNSLKPEEKKALLHQISKIRQPILSGFRFRPPVLHYLF